MSIKNTSSHFNLLAMFAVVIEQGSFSAAAVHLNTNQSTISTAMARLRELVGQELFVRSGRRIIPTSYAENLYGQVELPVAQLTGVIKSLETFDPATSQRKFVLAAPEHLQWIFHESFSNSPYPNLTLEVFEQPDTEEQALQDLLTQKYDAMIDIMPPDRANLVSEKLFEGDFVVVCREGHPRIQGSITEAQYMQESHAVLERKRNHLYSLRHYANIDVNQRKIAYHGRSLFSNMLFCSQSDCVTVLPTAMAMQHRQGLKLQVFKPPFEYSNINNYLIWLKKFNNDPAHKWLRGEFLRISSQLARQ